MPASVVGICNLALGRIGIDQFIEDLDDPNNRARACKNFYEPTRDQVLEDFPWDFAQSFVALAEVSGDPPAGWSKVYRVPSDALKVHVISTNFQFRPALWSAGSIWNYNLVPFDRAPFRQMSDATGRTILTDLDEAYAWYTRRVEDPNFFSALFASALAWKLAAELALVLKAKVDLAQLAGNTYLAEASRAQVLSLTQSQARDPVQSPSISARG